MNNYSSDYFDMAELLEELESANLCLDHEALRDLGLIKNKQKRKDKQRKTRRTSEEDYE